MVNTNIRIENAKIRFRNFSGKEGRFNPAGRRNFCVFLDDDTANDLADEGWNIKWLRPRTEDDEPQAYIQVAVSYANVPPKVWLVNSKQKTLLDENTISTLDWAELEEVDLVIRPYNYDVNGKSGVKAYLKTMYAKIVEDEFADKYEDVPDSAMSAMMG